MRSTAKKIRGLTAEEERRFKDSDAQRSREHQNGIAARNAARQRSWLDRVGVATDKSNSRAARSARRAAKKPVRRATEAYVKAIRAARASGDESLIRRIRQLFEQVK